MRYVAVILSFLVFAGCTTNHSRKNEITRIELARSGAWSDFGGTISIDSALDYKYWGDYANIKQAFFKGKITGKFWDTVNLRLEETKLKKAKFETGLGCKDCEYYELIIHWKNKKSRFLRTSDSSQDSLMTVIRWIDSSYKNLKLQRVNDSIKFEVTSHQPPGPPIKFVNFPPPVKK